MHVFIFRRKVLLKVQKCKHAHIFYHECTFVNLFVIQRLFNRKYAKIQHVTMLLNKELEFIYRPNNQPLHRYRHFDVRARL